jgi:L-glutamine-phosphate cytidylyltransferase
VIEKALILSAGQGKRLLPFTEQRPKCLLSFNGRTLLEWQIACLASNGISDVTVVTGFQADAVDAALRARPRDGMNIRTLFNPFFQVADNVGSCYLARDLMRAGEFVLLNGDTLFHPLLLTKAITEARGAITVTVDKKDRYDADDMKVHCEGGRLIRIGKNLTAAQANAESIGMLIFSAEGGELFAGALERTMRDPAGLQRWYLSVIDALATEHHVHVALIHGQEWCEVDYPKDLAAAGNLTARLWNEQTILDSERVSSLQIGRVM